MFAGKALAVAPMFELSPATSFGLSLAGVMRTCRGRHRRCPVPGARCRTRAASARVGPGPARSRSSSSASR